MNTLELKELKEVAQYHEECGTSMTVNPKVVLDLISNLESAVAINTDAAIAEIKAHDINLLIDKLSGLPFTIGVSCGYVKEFAANLRAGRKG